MNKPHVWIAAGALVALAAAGASAHYAVDAAAAFADEPPIFVLNGSLDFEAGAGSTWTLTAGSGYEHVPPAGTSPSGSNTLYVKVYLKGGGTCANGVTAHGKPVSLTYNQTAGKKVFTVNRAGAGTNYRTQVQPAQGMAASGAVLKYASAGYLESVRVAGGWSCDNLTAATLDKVAICASANDVACR
jgi:hypothetical protein